jgi:hypothetical protein
MKSHFIGHLSADHIEGKWWRLREPLGFYSARYNLTIFGPAGFVLDFASVKRVPVAYLIAGNTGHWEAAIHDVLYRFGQPDRHMADLIFYDAGRVRSRMRQNQSRLYRAGRLIRTSLMTTAVVTLGWIDYDPVPGCLDYRQKDRCGRDCQACDNFYPDWPWCICVGYAPDILERHRSRQ